MSHEPPHPPRRMHDIGVGGDHTIRIHRAPRRRGSRWQRFMRSRGGALVSAVLVIAIVAVAVRVVSRSAAQTATLYPATCLGGWTAPEKAAGLPETELGKSGDIGPDNAAVLDNANAEMFCGSFAGDLPENTEPVKVTLRPHWRIVPDGAAPVQKEEVSTGTPSVFIPTAYAQEIDDGSGTSGDAGLSGAPAPTEEPVVDSTPSEEPATLEPDQQPAEEPSPEEDQVPAPQDEVPTTTTEAASSTEAVPPVVETQSEPPILELEYTLDGASWKKFGNAYLSSWENASFQVPVPEDGWAGVQKIQVRIAPVPTLDTPPTVYVDGLELEVEYHGQEEALAQPAYDPLALQIGNIQAQGLPTPEVQANYEGGQDLVISGAPDGSLRIYKEEDPTFGMTSGISDAPLNISAYQFSPGRYQAFVTHDPDACAQETLDGCRNRPDTAASFSFAIATGTVALPGQPASSTEPTPDEPVNAGAQSVEVIPAQ